MGSRNIHRQPLRIRDTNSSDSPQGIWKGGGVCIRFQARFSRPSGLGTLADDCWGTCKSRQQGDEKFVSCPFALAPCQERPTAAVLIFPPALLVAPKVAAAPAPTPCLGKTRRRSAQAGPPPLGGGCGRFRGRRHLESGGWRAW